MVCPDVARLLLFDVVNIFKQPEDPPEQLWGGTVSRHTFSKGSAKIFAIEVKTPGGRSANTGDDGKSCTSDSRQMTNSQTSTNQHLHHALQICKAPWGDPPSAPHVTLKLKACAKSTTLDIYRKGCLFRSKMSRCRSPTATTVCWTGQPDPPLLAKENTWTGERPETSSELSPPQA